MDGGHPSQPRPAFRLGRSGVVPGPGWCAPVISAGGGHPDLRRPTRRRLRLRPQRRPGGRVRDMVVMFRPPPLPPRVLGLVVEIQHRRRIFVPIGRMTSAEADAVVLTTGSVNLRRFEQRPGEALVLGGLLDRTATVRETGARVTVIDAAMEQTRTRDWVLTRLAVRATRLPAVPPARSRPAAGVVRAGRPRSGPEDEQGADALLDVLAISRPADLANMLQDLDPKRRHEIAAALDDERLADVLERAARGRAGEDPRLAGRRAGRGHPRGDGPGRRRRPACRAARHRAGAAVPADGAGRGGPGAPAAARTPTTPPAG